MEHRDCETFQNGSRSSQKISKMLKCLHLHTFFSRLRVGTANKSGIEEAQYSYSLPKRPKLRSLLANQDDKGSLQKTHRRNSIFEQKSLVT